MLQTQVVPLGPAVHCTANSHANSTPTLCTAHTPVPTLRGAKQNHQQCCHIPRNCAHNNILYGSTHVETHSVSNLRSVAIIVMMFANSCKREFTVLQSDVVNLR
jgi:hypothetical protein